MALSDIGLSNDSCQSGKQMLGSLCYSHVVLNGARVCELGHG